MRLIRVMGAVMLCLVFAACGSPPSTGNPGSAASTTTAAPTSEQSSPPLDAVIRKLDAGVTFRAHLSVTRRNAAATGAIKGRYDASKAGSLQLSGFSMSMKLPAGSGKPQRRVRVIFHSDSIYINPPDTPGQVKLPPGVSWLHIPPSPESRAARTRRQQMEREMKSRTPGDTLMVLRDAVHLVKVNKERIRRVVADKYTGVLQIDDGVEEAPNKALRAYFKGLSDGGMRTIDVTIWVDSRDRLRRLTMKIGSGQANPIEVVATYSRWNDPVNISAPPATQVAPFGSVARAPRQEAPTVSPVLGNAAR